jgi:hypothetical protein
MNKILLVIVVVLVFFLAVGKGGGCHGGAKKSDTTVVHDTSWSVHDTTIYKTLIGKGKTLHDTIATPPQYIADTNYPKLLAQYNDLLGKYLALVEFRDTIRLDTLGYVYVLDTINQNSIKGRSVRTNYKIPTVTITKTITHYDPPKAQLYYGFGLDLNQTFAPTGAHGGLILKTKKDQLIGVQVGTGINGGINYGFQSYWKIKLK